MKRSRRLSAAASTRTNASPGPGCGASTRSTRTWSGPPIACKRAARIVRSLTLRAYGEDEADSRRLEKERVRRQLLHAGRSIPQIGHTPAGNRKASGDGIGEVGAGQREVERTEAAAHRRIHDRKRTLVQLV